MADCLGIRELWFSQHGIIQAGKRDLLPIIQRHGAMLVFKQGKPRLIQDAFVLPGSPSSIIPIPPNRDFIVLCLDLFQFCDDIFVVMILGIMII